MKRITQIPQIGLLYIRTINHNTDTFVIIVEKNILLIIRKKNQKLKNIIVVDFAVLHENVKNKKP